MATTATSAVRPGRAPRTCRRAPRPAARPPRRRPPPGPWRSAARRSARIAGAASTGEAPGCRGWRRPAPRPDRARRGAAPRPRSGYAGAATPDPGDEQGDDRDQQRRQAHRERRADVHAEQRRPASWCPPRRAGSPRSSREANGRSGCTNAFTSSSAHGDAGDRRADVAEPAAGAERRGGPRCRATSRNSRITPGRRPTSRARSATTGGPAQRRREHRQPVAARRRPASTTAAGRRGAAR